MSILFIGTDRTSSGHRGPESKELFLYEEVEELCLISDYDVRQLSNSGFVGEGAVFSFSVFNGGRIASQVKKKKKTFMT